MKKYHVSRSQSYQRYRDRIARLEMAARAENRAQRTHRLCVLGGAIERIVTENSDADTETLRQYLLMHIEPWHLSAVEETLGKPDACVQRKFR